MVFQICPRHPRPVQVYRRRRGPACLRHPCTSRNYHLIHHHSIMPLVTLSRSPRPLLQHTPGQATHCHCPYSLLRGRTQLVSSKHHRHLGSGLTHIQLTLVPSPSPHLPIPYHQFLPCSLQAPISPLCTNRVSPCTPHLLTLILLSSVLCIHMHGRHFSPLRIHPHLHLI